MAHIPEGSKSENNNNNRARFEVLSALFGQSSYRDASDIIFRITGRSVTEHLREFSIIVAIMSSSCDH